MLSSTALSKKYGVYLVKVNKIRYKKSKNNPRIFHTNGNCSKKCFAQLTN